MKLSGLFLMSLIPLSALAKSDYRRPAHFVGATQSVRADIESCIVSASATFSGVTYAVGHDRKTKNSLYKYSVSGHEVLDYQISVADTGENRIVHISHAYSENPEVKKMDGILLECVSLP